MNTVSNYGYSWSVAGMCGFFRDRKAAAKVNNNSCYSILSSFKFFYTIQHGGRSLDKHLEDDLRLTLRGRKNLCPDFPRIVGAIDRDKLDQLHDLYKLRLQRGILSQKDYQELLDASIRMYACALRIFQLRLLHKKSISFCTRKKSTDAWVTVRAKCTKNQRFVETKQVPDFVDAVGNRGSSF